MDRLPDRRKQKNSGAIPLWFKLFAMALAGLVAAKMLGLEVFVEVSYDGVPFLAALTDIRLYFVPLLLVLIYILSAWIWKKFFGSGKS